jgi:hypothetical protein
MRTNDGNLRGLRWGYRGHGGVEMAVMEQVPDLTSRGLPAPVVTMPIGLLAFVQLGVFSLEFVSAHEGVNWKVPSGTDIPDHLQSKWAFSI